MTILDALADPQLLGAAFTDAASWQAWRVFQSALFGLPMARRRPRPVSVVYGPPARAHGGGA
jgi:hypothetical protein